MAPARPHGVIGRVLSSSQESMRLARLHRPARRKPACPAAFSCCGHRRGRTTGKAGSPGGRAVAPVSGPDAGLVRNSGRSGLHRSCPRGTAACRRARQPHRLPCAGTSQGVAGPETPVPPRHPLLILSGFCGVSQKHGTQRCTMRARVESRSSGKKDVPARRSFRKEDLRPAQRSVDTGPSSRFCDARAPAPMRPASPGCCVKRLAVCPAMLRDAAAGLVDNPV
jgi:hypothetical protein